MPLLDRLGVGVDVQEVDAFRDHERPGDARLYERVFSAAEREYCLSQASPAQHFAARFAAKEAVVKAVSRFLELAMEEVEVVREPSGRPTVRLARGGDVLRVELSLSHSDGQAVAMAVAEHLEAR